jgi:phage terminase large subunit-like protein
MSRHGLKRVAVRHARKWTAEKGQKIRYSNPDDKFDKSFPEGELRWVCDNFDVIMVGYDEYQLHEFCSRLLQENVAAFEKFDQGKRRAVADKQLYDLIRDGNIAHNGNPDLTEHIQNANSTAGEDKAKMMRIVKRSNRLKIDLCVCASMGTDLAFKYLPE